MNNLEEVPPADEARTYRAKGYWSRFCVAVAGVAMNFALALVLLFVALVGFGVPRADTWYVNSVSPDSPAAAAGLEPSDRILSADGQSVATFDELTADHPGQARAKRSPSSSSGTVRSSPRSSPSPSAGPTRPSASASSASARPTPTRRSAR